LRNWGIVKGGEKCTVLPNTAGGGTGGTTRGGTVIEKVKRWKCGECQGRDRSGLKVKMQREKEGTEEKVEREHHFYLTTRWGASSRWNGTQGKKTQTSQREGLKRVWCVKIVQGVTSNVIRKRRTGSGNINEKESKEDFYVP